MPADGKLPDEPDWADIRVSFAGIPEVEPEWVIQNQPSVTILDVRDADEIDESLSGLNNLLHIPLAELRARVHEVPTDKPVVTLCRSGKRSSLAIGILKAAGHQQLANIHGGILHWHQQ
jgi:rhodanese-related sulfurtransferase